MGGPRSFYFFTIDNGFEDALFGLEDTAFAEDLCVLGEVGVPLSLVEADAPSSNVVPAVWQSNKVALLSIPRPRPLRVAPFLFGSLPVKLLICVLRDVTQNKLFRRRPDAICSGTCPLDCL